MILSHILCIFASFVFGAMLTRFSLDEVIARNAREIVLLRKKEAALIALLKSCRELLREECRRDGDAAFAALDELREASGGSPDTDQGTVEELSDPLERNYR